MKKSIQSKKRRVLVEENPVEAKRNDIPTSVADSLVNDLIKPAATTDLWEQLLGANDSATGEFSTQGDLTAGETIDIQAIEEQLKDREKKVVAPAIDYHRDVIRSSEKIVKENSFVLERRIQEIMVELKKLANSSQELQVVFRQVTIEKTPVNPGQYHLNFFEWVLSVIRSARLKVDESKTWLALFASKRAKRSYWAMFKKHGTTFGLSHERVVATQTG